MSVSDLDKLRSIEELEEYQKQEVKPRLVEIENEFAGLPFSDAARDEYTELKEENDEIDKRVAELTKRREYLQSLNGDKDRAIPPTVNKWRPADKRDEDPYDLSTIRAEFGDPEVAGKQVRDRAMRALERAHFPHPEVNREDAQAHVERLLEQDGDSGQLARRMLLTGSTTYKRAFVKKLYDEPLSSEEQRALSLGTPKAGAGLAVPFQLDPTVIMISNGVVNPMRAASRVETLTATDEWRGITSTAVTAQYRAEGAEATDNSPTIAQPTVRVQRADAFVPYSRELSQDWGGLLQSLATAIQDGKDELESVQFWSGAGTTVFPQGLFTGLTTTQRVSTATSGAFVLADLYALSNALPPRHRPRGSFMGNLTNLNRIRALDIAGTAYVKLDAARPGTLLGQTAYENSAMGTALTLNVPILVYGDFSKYLIVDRVGMEVEIIPNLFGATSRFPTGQRAMFAFWRNSAIVLDSNAFRYLAAAT